jgi:tight adherence protein C
VSLAAALAGGSGAALGCALGELAGAARRRRRRWGALSAVVARVGAGLGIRAPRGLAARVAAAGVDRPVADVVALQAGLALLAALVVAPLAPAAPGRLGVALVLAAPAAGFAAPEVGLRRRARARGKTIAAELPDVLDLLRVAVGAGLTPRRALAEVGRRHPGLLARELRRATQRARLGEPIERALDGLEARCPAEGIPALVAALRRAEIHGAPLAPTLAAQAAEARSLRAARRSELAARAAPKIPLVVALLLVPAVLLLITAALFPALAGR